MTQSQRQEEPRRCPRCGGLMIKPAGSSLYWHAEYNHPRCDITNLTDPPVVVQTTDADTDEEATQPPKARDKRQKK